MKLSPRSPCLRGILLLCSLQTFAYSAEPAWLEGVTLKPTYTEGAGLIIEHRCVHCHRPGEIAPMSFLTFPEFRKWSRDTYTPMPALIEERAMPPWPADPSVGAFTNKEFITQAEMDVLVEWLKAGLPRGPGEYEPQIDWVQGWNIGQPDHVFELPETALSEDSTGEFKTFTIVTTFPEDRWIVASEARPEETTVVTAIEAGPLGAYQSGNTSVVYPPGSGRRLKAGETVEVRVHYRKDAGYGPTEKSKLGVVFAKGSTEDFKEVHVEKLEADPFTIPKGERGFTRELRFDMPAGGRIVAVMPVLHERGVSVRYDAAFPDGRTKALLSIPAWDARWKFRYEFAEPIAAPAGTVITVRATYDNSAENLKNPDPWSDAAPGPNGETLQGWISYTLD